MINACIIGSGHGKHIHEKALSLIRDCKVKIYNKQLDSKLNLKNISNNNTDFIIIASPTYTHTSLIKKIIIKEIPFICEKPAGLSIAELVQIKKIIIKSCLKNCFAYQFRYDPWLKKVKNILDNQLIGVISQVHITWNTKRSINIDAKSWKNKSSMGGGIIWNYIPHIIDYLSWTINSKKELLKNLKINSDNKNDFMKRINFSMIISNVIVKVQVSNNEKNNFGHKILFKGSNGTIKLNWAFPYKTKNSELELQTNKLRKIKVLKKKQEIFSNHDNRLLPTYLMLKDFIKLIKNSGSKNKLANIDDAIFVHKNLKKINRKVSGERN